MSSKAIVPPGRSASRSANELSGGCVCELEESFSHPLLRPAGVREDPGVFGPHHEQSLEGQAQLRMTNAFEGERERDAELVGLPRKLVNDHSRSLGGHE